MARNQDRTRIRQIPGGFGDRTRRTAKKGDYGSRRPQDGLICLYHPDQRAWMLVDCGTKRPVRPTVFPTRRDAEDYAFSWYRAYPTRVV